MQAAVRMMFLRILSMSVMKALNSARTRRRRTMKTGSSPTALSSWTTSASRRDSSWTDTISGI
jgi:hypothetical protein